MNDRQKAELKHEIVSLDWEIPPERDLWPDISSRIRFSEKSNAHVSAVEKVKTKRYWAPAAIAASMVFALGALVFSSMTYQQSQLNYAMQANYINFQKTQISLIEQQHKKVRAQFVVLLSGQYGDIDPTTVAEVQAVLMTIDSASAELKQAILAQPMNTNYSTMLARTYQEELKLLNKFKTKNGTSI